MRKHVFVWLVMALLLIGARTVSATELGTGLKEPEVIAVPERVVSEDVIDPERLSETENADAETDKWNAYSSKYYYNQLDEEYKEVWDALDVVCKSYFDGSRNVSGYTDSVSLPEGTTLDELQVFWRLYIFSNPQYYFLRNAYSYSFRSDNQKPVSVKLGIYQAFCDAEDRAEATEKVENQLTVWQAEIDACTTDSAKLQKIQDLICAKVTYNYDAANNKVDEEVSFSQSPYSVLCGNSTVCAGYADTFYMLCNASGIDAISVTSLGHQWNKARVNGSWYNFDTTWDDNSTDSRGYPVYRYHGRSDAMYDVDMNSGFSSNIANHQEEEFWEGYIPACNLDSNPTGDCSIPGLFAAASGQVATPVITFTFENSKTKANLSCETLGASIYYTTDGTKPAVAETKSLKYSGAFAVNENTCIRAVAVKDSYTDSVIAERVVELEKHAITYVLDGGVNHADNPMTYTVRDNIVLQAPLKTGYIFDGWYCDEAYTEKVAAIEKGTEGPLTFYAKWIPITYNIAFDGNEATSGSMMPLTSCIYDREYTLSQQGYAREGYVFAGWNTEADGSGIAYADEASVKNLMTEKGATATLYAQWNPIVYSICFDGNGSEEGEMSAVDACEYNEEVTLPANAYTRTGQVFAGWNTEADGSGDSYEDGEPVKNLTMQAGATVTLYAQWKVISYTIVFDGNGATAGSMESQEDCEYNGSYELTANNYVRSGYVYAGWNTEADGSGDSYTDQEKVKNLLSEDGAEFILYAQWKPITYTVSFDGNGATAGETETLICNYDGSYEISANGYEKSGYTFTGWNSEKDGSGTYYAEGVSVKNLSATDGATITLYAQWTADIYSVIFDGNGATEGTMSAMTHLSRGKTYELSANGYLCTGYVFVGWNTKADGSGDSYVDGAQIYNLDTRNTDTILLYAQWSPIVYKVSFDGNGATGGETESLTACEYDRAYVLTSNGFVRVGYRFTGWNTSADGSGKVYSDKEEIKNLISAANVTVTLYAQWSPIEYEVSFDGNGATSGATESLTACKYDGSYALSANSFVKTGYIFTGWNTKADGSGMAYREKEEIKNLTTDADVTVTLYAQWNPIVYKVSFNGNGATSGATAPLTACEYDSSYVLTANSFARTGYTFTGWNTKANGSGTAYTNKASVKNLTTTEGAVITLYAQWKTNSYTIKFDGNKAGKGSMKSMTSLLYGKSYGLASNKYKRTGYRFDGWNTAKNGKGVAVKNKATVKNLSAKDGGVVILYAQWKANKYNVKFHGNGATSGSMKKMKGRIYDKKFKLSANKFKREGYKFVGWNTKKNGKGKMYKNKAKVKNLTSKNGKTVTLYAQWKKM